MTERRHAVPGDEISVLFTGRYRLYDPDFGYHHIEGSYVDEHGQGHVPWTIRAHWSADLHVLDRYEKKLERPAQFPTTAEWIKALVKARQDAEAQLADARMLAADLAGNDHISWKSAFEQVRSSLGVDPGELEVPL